LLYRDGFREMLDLAGSLNYRIRRLDEIAAGLDRSALPVRGLTLGLIPGRAFRCAV
jgi:hypothetical protein